MIDLDREKLKKKSILAYLTHPFTRPSTTENKKKAMALAIEIMMLYPLMTVLIAHTSTCPTMNKVDLHHACLGDIQIIAKCDLVIHGVPLDYEKVSSGCFWEHKIAQFFNKPICTSDYLLGKVSKPNIWAKSEEKFAKPLKVEKGSRFEELCTQTLEKE